jgi:1,4-dihydroxy-2-naphthoate octaprenyltransferase
MTDYKTEEGKRKMKRFLDYVEIRTKITSTFTFLMSLAILLYQKQSIRWDLTCVFFASMFLFDLTTTAINNYIDTKSNGQLLPFSRKTALYIIYILFGLSTVLGLYLAFMTDIVILLTGGICFLCGIFYTYGPVPISRQPLGEVLSGAFYGILIPFLIFYINTPEGTYLLFSVSFEKVLIELKIVPILILLLIAIIPFCTTANIMLANNICDLEKDILVKRHTLPYYIGRKALYLYAGLYYLTYLAAIALILLKIIPTLCVLSVFTIFMVQRNIRKFFELQDKRKTFILAIKNFMIIMGGNTLCIYLSILITFIT